MIPVDRPGWSIFMTTVIHPCTLHLPPNQVGDILIQGERGAHVILAPEVAEYITGSLASVRSVPVKNSFIAVAELGVRPPVKKEVRWMVGWLLAVVL